mgnify:CR=1 FL=1
MAVTSAPLTPESRRLFPLSREMIADRLRRPAPTYEHDELHRVAIKEGVRVTEAAVLVPLVNRDAGIQVLLTQRTGHLRDHGGQVSFPGGRVEPGDVDREATALRETVEETGLTADRVTLLGRLPGYEIPSGFRITPVVGWVEPPFSVVPDAFEVADIFEAPLAYFLDPANYQRRQFHFRGRQRHYLAVPWDGRYIWGATAGMLYSLCRLLDSE